MGIHMISWLVYTRSLPNNNNHNVLLLCIKRQNITCPRLWLIIFQIYEHGISKENAFLTSKQFTHKELTFMHTHTHTETHTQRAINLIYYHGDFYGTPIRNFSTPLVAYFSVLFYVYFYSSLTKIWIPNFRFWRTNIAIYTKGLRARHHKYLQKKKNINFIHSLIALFIFYLLDVIRLALAVCAATIDDLISKCNEHTESNYNRKAKMIFIAISVGGRATEKHFFFFVIRPMCEHSETVRRI